MSFSKEWDKQYAAGQHMSVWPWTDVVVYVMRYARPKHTGCRVLEIGCGAGANISFLQSLGFEYFGVDGSETIISELQKRYPANAANFMACDFTEEIPFEGKFDLILDRGSLTHNSTSNIQNALKLVGDQLTDDGKFIGVTWFSTEYSEYQNGKATREDAYTRDSYTTGGLANVGIVHFCDQQHLESLLADFQIEVLEHQEDRRVLPDDGFHFAAWRFVAHKPSKSL